MSRSLLFNDAKILKARKRRKSSQTQRPAPSTRIDEDG